jgi:hypothetical protein
MHHTHIIPPLSNILLIPPNPSPAISYAWGNTQHGQLALTNPNQNHWQPTLADGLREWRCARVCFGTYHAAARTVDGSVLTWGRQFECCLGRKSVMDDQIGEPGTVEALPRAAFLHCIFVTFGQV